MKVVETIEELRAERAGLDGALALVPTMGALHEGHLTLMREARETVGKEGAVAASIFVNPTQFGPSEDLDAYPRPLEDDLTKCEAEGVDLVFAPEPGEVYFPDRSMSVTENSLSRNLCGASRPGHFDGVCLVVLKLFQIFQPEFGVFGKKDYQQLAVIRRMVRDLNVPVGVVGVDTVREQDGLALSSRNLYLSEEERRQAPTIRQTLLSIGKEAKKGRAKAADLIEIFRERIAEGAPLGQIDYIEIVDREDLEAISGKVDRPALAAAAVHFSGARLIDNLEIGPEQS